MNFMDIAETSHPSNRDSHFGSKMQVEAVIGMFQPVLTEERLSAELRVWFARLQVQVMHIALKEHYFAVNAAHPARLLVDRMSACALGFETTEVGRAELEREMKRIVQIIEQYPEEGRRAYQAVYLEFQSFLSTFVRDGSLRQPTVSISHQVEQRKTFSIQYTIEIRKLLCATPVADGLRDFLFKVWVDVIAVAAVRYGQQHPDVLDLLEFTAKLIRASSETYDGCELVCVTNDLQGMRLRLRAGMTSIGIEPKRREQYMKSISDILLQTFQTRSHR